MRDKGADRRCALQAVAESFIRKVVDEPIVKAAVDIALRKRQRRLIKIIIAIDGRGDEIVTLQRSITHKPIPKVKKKAAVMGGAGGVEDEGTREAVV